MYDLERTSNDDYEWKIKNDGDLMAAKTALYGLRKIKKRKLLSVFMCQGICRQIKPAQDVNTSIRDRAFVTWEHYSGYSRHWPVPAPDGSNPSDKYLDAVFLWNPLTKYGRLRWNLLDHVIKTFEQEIEHYEKETSQAKEPCG